MTKKTVVVTHTVEIEIEIDDSILNDEYVKSFSGYMWEIDDVDDLFKYAARMCSDNEDQFVEGIGEALWKRSLRVNEIKPLIKYHVIDEEYEEEIQS